MTPQFSGKLGVIQRVLPEYRAPFFTSLAKSCTGGLSLAFGEPRAVENIRTTMKVDNVALVKTNNLHFLNGQLYLCYQQGLENWLEAYQPDALIVEANPRYLSTPKAIQWMHSLNRPVLGWGLGISTSTSLLTRQRRHFLNQFDGLIAYSQKGAQEYAKTGFNPQSIFVAYNAVTHKPKQPLPQKNDSIQGAPIVLFVGRLQERKRVDDLIRACAKIPCQFKPELWVIGEGPVKSSLENLASQIFPNTRFFGALFGDELASKFLKADLFVLPGTGGLAIQQAMSYGLPIIVARGDGTQNDLVRPTNGWQISPNNVDELVQTMITALSNPLELQNKGIESYRIVSEEINIENMVSVFIQAIQHAQEKFATRQVL